MLKLYPPQQLACEWAKSRSRFILNFDTGCGKTPTVIQALGLEGHILVVCPAIVRWHWADHFRQHGCDSAVITEGRTRAGRSKPAIERVAKSFAAQIQIVSYELLDEVDTEGWDAVIFDEMHYLQNARSQRSRLAFSLQQMNPLAVFAGLTATLTPTQPKGLWNLLRTFWPDTWGKPTKSGEPNWQFCVRYLNQETNDYGTVWTTFKPERQEELAQKIAQVSYRMTRADLAQYLPPLDLHALYIDKPWGVTEWMSWFSDNSGGQVGVFTYYRESATKVYVEAVKSGAKAFLITGAETPERRIQILADAKAIPNCVIVCTICAVGIGISLSWLSRFLCVEWTASPGQMLQFLGRFNRLDTTTCPSGQFLVTPDQEIQAATLIQRIDDINRLARASNSSLELRDMFQQEFSEDDFQMRLDKLVANYIGDSEEDESDDE